jgi:hypothetical protein
LSLIAGCGLATRISDCLAVGDQIQVGAVDSRACQRSGCSWIRVLRLEVQVGLSAVFEKIEPFIHGCFLEKTSAQESSALFGIALYESRWEEVKFPKRSSRKDYLPARLKKPEKSKGGYIW